MQIAARNGNLDIVKFLAGSGASTATRGKRGDTLFHIAAGNGHVAVLRWLAERGGGRMHSLLDMHGQSAAHVAARRGEVAVLRLLREELRMDLAGEDFEGLTPAQHLPRVALLGNEEGVAACREYLVAVQSEDLH
jgi:ankyrin repeat protein